MSWPLLQQPPGQVATFCTASRIPDEYNHLREITMGYHPRIETADLGCFITTRARNSELWFVNNPLLETAILGYTAKYAARYGAKLYAMAIEGNHIHIPAMFPRRNRAGFMRDLNSSIARAVDRFSEEYPGGRFWGRRYSCEFLPAAEDIENQFFYTVLQPVQDGLVERISDYPGYNCFHDAAWGKKRKFKVVNYKDYNEAKRKLKNANIRDYTETVTLQYERLPGYEDMSQEDYAKMLNAKLEQRRLEIVQKRKSAGLGFAGAELLKQTPGGARPKHTKLSIRTSHRPRILCICPIRRAKYRAWYFDIYARFRKASAEYRAGVKEVIFPPGTYPPWLDAVTAG